MTLRPHVLMKAASKRRDSPEGLFRLDLPDVIGIEGGNDGPLLLLGLVQS